MENCIILFQRKENCCGCGACRAACPRHAITMEKDIYGFRYPVIASELCISCGICRKVCAYQQKRENSSPRKVYALSSKNTDILQKSSSGGVFSGIAERLIEEGGVVFGAAFIKEQGELTVRHCSAMTKKELKKQLGSKYVQSDLGDTFAVAKDYLEKGKKVLYSGTPCQIAGLKAYLGTDYDNLLTMDLVCHGVPSNSMFREYLKSEEARIEAPIEDLKFRDKDYGWGLNAKLYYRSRGEVQSSVIPSYESSYYELFLKGEIYRHNCYECPYANEHRPADLTIGDFWGIEEEHPEYLQPTGMLSQSAGISMLMINSRKGEVFFEQCKSLFWYYPSTFENASRHNEQLKHPSFPGKNRDMILKLYKEKGYKAVDKWFWKQKQKQKRKENIKYHLHNDIPTPIRTIIKKIIGRE